MSVLTRRGAISSSLIAQAAPVTFGTPVAQALDSSGGDTLAFAMSGVVSGQPIVIFWMPFQYQATDVVSVTDTFGTSYTWTTVDNNTNADGYGIVSMIGTGGVGTSGTITVTTAHSNDGPGGVAIPAIGASTASGLAAIDTHNVGTNAASTTVDSISLTPAAHHEGAIYAAAQSAYATPAITASPGSPWSDTGVTGNGATFMDVATYSSPAIGTALTTLWGLNSSEPSVVAGIVLKAGTGGGGGGGTPAMPQTIVYDLDGDYTWTAPPGVDDVTVNSTLFAVTPGTVYDIVVGGTCSFNSTDVSGSTVSLTYTYNPGIVGGVSLGQYQQTMEAMSSGTLATTCTNMKTIGCTYVRIECIFTGGTTVPTTYDTVISAIKAAGMKPLIILEDFSSGGKGVFGTGSGSYAAWCPLAVEHFVALIGAGATYELSNEVNLGGNWASGTVDPATYATCVASAVPAMLDQDSTAVILTSGLSAYGSPTGATSGADLNPVDFVAAFYDEVSPCPCAAWNLHPYTWSALGDGEVNGGYPNEAETYNPFDTIGSMYSSMSSHSDGAKKIWCTEFGYEVGTNNGGNDVTMTADQQACGLAIAFQVWASLSYTGPFLVFSYEDESDDGDWGLYESDGDARPALAIFEAGTVVTGGGGGTPLPIVPGSLTGVPTTIVFDDEFDTGTLDTTTWDNTYAGTSSVLNGTTTVASNVTVDSGGAELTFISTSSGACITTNPAPKEAGWPGATATGFRVTPPASGGSVYVEWKMNLPSSGGDIANWPACWMSGDPLYPSSNWPTTGEIDIMEGLNYGECGFSLHWGSTVGTDEGETVGYDTAITGGEHTFGVLWTTTGLTFVYDGVVQGTHTFGAGTETTVMTTNPMYLVAQNVGRQNTAPDVSGAIVSVRYCRVWQNSTAPSTPVVAAIPNQSATVGDALSPAIQPSATGGVLPYSWVVSGLPTGLTYSTTTGEITGTPTGTASTDSVTVTVTDADGHSDSTSFTLTVSASSSGNAPNAPVTINGVTTPTIEVWGSEFDQDTSLDLTKWLPCWNADNTPGNTTFGTGGSAIIMREENLAFVSGGLQITLNGTSGAAYGGVINSQPWANEGPYTVNEALGITSGDLNGDGQIVGFEGFAISPEGGGYGPGGSGSGPVYIEWGVTDANDGSGGMANWAQAWIAANSENVAGWGNGITDDIMDELDVMESGGIVNATAHWDAYGASGRAVTGFGMTGGEFHTVGCLWTTAFWAIVYDGVVQGTLDMPSGVGLPPEGVICALGYGGLAPVFPATCVFKYVRVYQGT